MKKMLIIFSLFVILSLSGCIIVSVNTFDHGPVDDQSILFFAQISCVVENSVDNSNISSGDKLACEVYLTEYNKTSKTKYFLHPAVIRESFLYYYASNIEENDYSVFIKNFSARPVNKQVNYTYSTYSGNIYVYGELNLDYPYKAVPGAINYFGHITIYLDFYGEESYKTKRILYENRKDEVKNDMRDLINNVTTENPSWDWKSFQEWLNYDVVFVGDESQLGMKEFN